MIATMDSMPDVDLRPMDYGEVLDRTLVMYRRNWRLALSLSVPILFPSALVVGLTNIGYQWAVQTQFASPRPDPSRVVFAGLAVAAFFAATGAHALLNLFVQGLLAKAGSDLYMGRHVTAAEVYRFGLRHAFVLLITMILLTLGVSLGLVFLVVPGLILSVFWGFAIQAIVVEEQGLTAALGRSWHLVQGYWWHTAVFMFLLGILVWVLEMIVITPSQVLTIVELVSHPEAIFPGATPNVLALAAQGLFSSVATALVAPLGAFALTLFYYDLRMRKEGLDLVMRARKLAPASSPAE